LSFLQNPPKSFLAGELQFHRAEWTRGEVIRRFTPGLGLFGLWRSAPGHGKSFREANWEFAQHGLACERGLPAQRSKSAPPRKARGLATLRSRLLAHSGF